jgi:dTDP-4-dehydrorhamnose 3,5-epimerase
MPLDIRELSIPGALELTPRQFPDDRGLFLEAYRFEGLEEAIGHRFELAQANVSVSRKGVVRGIHYADVPPGQAKYVTCTNGAIIDYIIDLRVGSPTFGQWDSVRLDDVDRRAVYIPEGFGHCFVALADNTTVMYFVSSVFNLEREHGINPLDPQVALVFPEEAGEPLLSPKDLEAPSLEEALALGALPTLDQIAALRAVRAAG